MGDVVQALIRMGVHDGAVGSILNIGSDLEVTINELAAVAKQVTGSSSPIRHVSWEEAYGENFEDRFRRLPDLSRFVRRLATHLQRTFVELAHAVTDSLVQRSQCETQASLLQAD